MHLSTPLILSCAAAGALAFVLPAASSSYAVKERHQPPRVWTAVGPAPKSANIHLQLGLKQSNDGEIERHLLEVSDPFHERYGQHLTLEEVNDIVAPSDETVALVHAWLLEHDITPLYSPARDWVSIVVPIETAERLLQTEYSVFEHEDDGSRIMRAPEWSLPKHLHDHIDVVQPTTSFFRPNAQRKHIVTEDSTVDQTWWENVGKAAYGADAQVADGSLSKVCNINFTTPTCIRTLYGTINYTPKVPTKNGVAVNDYLNETSYRKDIYQFLSKFRPDAAKAANTFPVHIIANATNDQGPYTKQQLAAGTNEEADLDAELVLSISYPTTFSVFSTGGSPPYKPDNESGTVDTNEPYLTFQTYALAQKNLPQVISSSYGDDEQTVPPSYANRVCKGFAQLGARGISLLVSSGDDGVGPKRLKDCTSNSPPYKDQFVTAFPAGCPYVTAVGATQAFSPEVAVTRYASGAGFSNYFKQPSYQSKAVNAYVKALKGKYKGLYNPKGRAYPDVAAQGNHDAIVYAGNVTTVGGTSASSPTFAAVIALVNDALIAKGKSPLGFLNPWIYGGGYKALNDITTGSSYGCGTKGFPATKGWDAVTGWGTPNFPKLVKAALAKKS